MNETGRKINTSTDVLPWLLSDHFLQRIDDWKNVHYKRLKDVKLRNSSSKVMFTMCQSCNINISKVGGKFLFKYS